MENKSPNPHEQIFRQAQILVESKKIQLTRQRNGLIQTLRNTNDFEIQDSIKEEISLIEDELLKY